MIKEIKQFPDTKFQNYLLAKIQRLIIYLDLFVLQKQYEDSNQKRSRVGWAVVDTLIWQGLASVAIPGFTINRICTFTGVLLKRGVSWPGPARKWVTTAVGLLSIPIIIKPIDKSVDFLMENTLRRWYHIGPVLKDLVHHNRNDWPELNLEILDQAPLLTLLIHTIYTVEVPVYR